MKGLQQHPEVDHEIEDYALYLAEQSDRLPFALLQRYEPLFVTFASVPRWGTLCIGTFAAST